MSQDTTQATLTVKGFTPYAQIPRWIIRSGDALSHGAVRLYGAIMTYADNDTKAAFPGREKLAGDMGVKIRSISTYIKELEDFGAIAVTRRRNKKTGNFYANHYVLVFSEPSAENCTPPDAADDPITRPTILNIDPPSFTSDESDKQETVSRSKQASPPKNPGGLTHQQRQNLRQAMMHAAQRMKNANLSFWDDDVQELWWVFIGLIEDYFPNEYDSQFSDLLENGKWSISAKESTPLQAGIQLNKLINTALGQ